MKLNIVLPLLLSLSSNVCLAANELLFVSVNSHLVDTRLDPIVNPGTCSGHVHSVYGSSAFADNVWKNDVTNTNWQDDTGKEFLTTSNVIPNKSMYWAPSLYIYNDDDKMYYLVPSFSRTYYRIIYPNDSSASNVRPFPTNLRIVVGDASRKTPWHPSDEHDEIKWTNRTWNREDTNSSYHGDWSYLKGASVKDIGRMKQLEMHIRIPSCLQVRKSDGMPRIMSFDHRSHAAYPDGLTCPDSHPYHMPEIQFEVRYELDEIRNQIGDLMVNDPNNWILSTGDTMGASAHADFISGWPEELMESIIESCRDGEAFGNGECPIEKYMDKTRDEMKSKVVEFTNDIPNEVVSPVSSLPKMNDPCCIGC